VKGQGPPPALDRARAGDWEGFEDLLGQTLAPTFDAAVHLFGGGPAAATAAEDALFDLLESVRRGRFTHGDPLKWTARTLVRGARAAGRAPLEGGLAADDLVELGLAPGDGRGPAVGRLPVDDRLAATLDVALDLEPRDLAFALEKPEAEAAAALARAFKAVPHARPREALRDVFDRRAARERLPAGAEDRVLDRLEKAW